MARALVDDIINLDDFYNRKIEEFAEGHRTFLGKISPEKLTEFMQGKQKVMEHGLAMMYGLFLHACGGDKNRAMLTFESFMLPILSDIYTKANRAGVLETTD